MENLKSSDGREVIEPGDNNKAPAYLKQGLIVPQQQIRASGGDLNLRCAHCGSMKFRVHVRPIILPSGEERAGPTVIVCGNSKCGRQYKIDDQGLLESRRHTGIGDLNNER